MVVSELRIYEFLTKELKIEDAAAKRYVQDIVRAEEKLEQQVETKIDKKFEDAKSTLATKEDIHILREEISQKHNDLLKWMIVMWITQLGAIVAIIKLMIH